jgi:hypothetical protein
LDVGVLTFKFGFKLDAVGKQGGLTIAEAMTAVVDQARRETPSTCDLIRRATSS